MGEAFSKIKSGEYTSLAVVGAESVSTKLNSVWWRNIHAINETEEDPRTAVSPFSKNRKGTALSEGAVCLFLENLEIALARNAKIYAEIISYSINTGTETFTKPSLSSQKSLMIDAINKVGIDNVTYINAHGTGTPVGDISELQAINEALGSYCKNIPISSTKSLTGHLMGAASAMESISCILTLKNNKVIPNFFLTERDPIINQDIFLPTTPVTSDMNVVLNNSFAFGGTNVILGFKKWK
jgi:3-oxoacyl-[acyl-carrier-protein] synthase II